MKKLGLLSLQYPWKRPPNMCLEEGSQVTERPTLHSSSVEKNGDQSCATGVQGQGTHLLQGPQRQSHGGTARRPQRPEESGPEPSSTVEADSCTLSCPRAAPQKALKTITNIFSKTGSFQLNERRPAPKTLVAQPQRPPGAAHGLRARGRSALTKPQDAHGSVHAETGALALLSKQEIIRAEV